jgi:hypothetical protein
MGLSSRWHLWPARRTRAYRILWLGDPRSLPVGGWSIMPGLSYALTSDQRPDTTDVLTPASPGPANLASQAV